MVQTILTLGTVPEKSLSQCDFDFFSTFQNTKCQVLLLDMVGSCNYKYVCVCVHLIIIYKFYVILA